MNIRLIPCHLDAKNDCRYFRTMTTNVDLDRDYGIFISRGYVRPLVTRFLNSFPGTQEDLSRVARVSQGTIIKLRDSRYPMDTSAKKIWDVIEKGLEFLRECFDLEKKSIEKMVRDLLTIDFSDSNIVSLTGDEELHFPGRPLSSVIEELETISGTFTTLKLSNNFLTHEGTDIDDLIDFLSTQNHLQYVECRSLHLCDRGIIKFADLLKRNDSLLELDLRGNYGPSEELRMELKNDRLLLEPKYESESDEE